MRGILRIGQVDAMKKIAQDASGTIFSRGVATQVSPLFEHARPRRYLSQNTVFENVERENRERERRRRGRCRPCGRTERAHRGLEISHSTRDSHSVHIDHFLFEQEKKKRTKNKNSLS